MDRYLVAAVQRQKHSISELQCLIEELLRDLSCRSPSPPLEERVGQRRPLPRKSPGYNLDVMFTKPVEAQPLARWKNLPIRPHFLVAMIRRPLGYVGMKALAILHHWRQQHELSALPQLLLQPPPHFIARLRFHRHLAVRTKLRA